MGVAEKQPLHRQRKLHEHVLESGSASGDLIIFSTQSRQ
jgi:hypothetical protein